MPCWEHTQEQAEALLEEAIELESDSKQVKSLKILTHLLEHHLDVVEETEIHQWMGSCYRFLKQYDQATHHLKLAWDLSSEDEHGLNLIHILKNLATSLLLIGRYKEALKYFNIGEKYFDSYTNQDWATSRFSFRLHKGRCLIFLSQNEDGLSEFHKAVSELNKTESVNENNAKLNLINFEIGRAYIHMNEIEKAANYLTKINIELLYDSFHQDYYMTLLRIHYEKYDYQAILDTFKLIEEEFLHRNYKSQAYYYAGMAYLRLGEKEKAKHYLALAKEHSQPSKWEYDYATKYLEEINQTPISKLINYLKRLFTFI